MQIHQIDSPVCPTEELARASVDGAVMSLGKEGSFELVSVIVKEVEGGWVATIVAKMIEVDPEAEDSTGSGSGSQDSSLLPDRVRGDEALWLYGGAPIEDLPSGNEMVELMEEDLAPPVMQEMENDWSAPPDTAPEQAEQPERAELADAAMDTVDAVESADTVDKVDVGLADATPPAREALMAEFEDSGAADATILRENLTDEAFAALSAEERARLPTPEPAPGSVV